MKDPLYHCGRQKFSWSPRNASPPRAAWRGRSAPRRSQSIVATRDWTSPPYEGYERDGAAAIKHVPAEQLDTKHAPGGAVSAKPVVLSNDGASPEGGARERNADSKREP